MALVRMGVAFVILWSILDVILRGLVGVVWIDKAFGGYRSLGQGTLWIKWLGGPNPTVVWSLTIGALVSGLCLFLGLGGRLTAFIALQCYMPLHRLNGQASGSGDIAVDNLLWLLFLSRPTATLSLDAWIKQKRLFSDEKIQAFPRYLVLFQLIIIYFTTGIQKISVYWLPMGGFSAIYYILQQPSWQRFDMTWAAKGYLGTQISTAVTWIWEVTAPVLWLIYYYRRTPEKGGRLRRWMNRYDLRPWWAGFGVGLHAIIFATMSVGPFTPIMLAMYPCLWSPEELRSVGERMRRMWMKPPAGDAE